MQATLFCKFDDSSANSIAQEQGIAALCATMEGEDSLYMPNEQQWHPLYCLIEREEQFACTWHDTINIHVINTESTWIMFQLQQNAVLFMEVS